MDEETRIVSVTLSQDGLDTLEYAAETQNKPFPEFLGSILDLSARNQYLSRTMNELTGDMRIIAQVCGMECARALLTHYSGQRVYIHKNKLLSKLRADLAEKLRRSFGGNGWVTVPTERRTAYQSYMLALALRDEGFSTKDIAVKLGVTHAYVFQLFRKGKEGTIKPPEPKEQVLEVEGI